MNIDLHGVAENAKKIKKQIADEAGVSPSAINDSNLKAVSTALDGAQRVAAAGENPTAVPIEKLKAAGGATDEESSKKDLKNQQKIAMAIAAIAPSLIGFAMGGNEGGAIGAKVSGDYIKNVGDQEKEEAKNARELAEKKELRSIDAANRESQAEKDRELRRQIAEESNQTRKDIAAENANLRRDLLAGKNGGLKLTKGEEAVDKKFATEYNDFILAGGSADISKSVTDLNDVITQLGQTDTASGPLIGKVPKGIRDVITPGGAAIQDKIENVVQRSLRTVLGAQFTEAEGKQLLARAYNPSQPESENIKRVQSLAKAIELAGQAKLAAANYFEENGTMKGFKGASQVNIADIEKLAGQLAAQPTGGKGNGFSLQQNATAAPAAPDFDNMSADELKKYLGR